METAEEQCSVGPLQTYKCIENSSPLLTNIVFYSSYV